MQLNLTQQLGGGGGPRIPRTGLSALWREIDGEWVDTIGLSASDYYRTHPVIRSFFFTRVGSTITLVDQATAVTNALASTYLNKHTLVGKAGVFVALYAYDTNPEIIKKAIKYAKSQVVAYYVDILFGSDDNNGLTTASPFQSLAKLSSVLQSGDWVYLARGSVWYETLAISALENVAIYPFGTGAPPEIDCSDPILSSNWTEHSTYTDIYKVDWAVEATLITNYTGGKGKILLSRGDTRETTEILHDITSAGTYTYTDQTKSEYWQAQLDLVTSGFYYDWLAQVLYCKAPELADPRVDDKMYRATKRAYGVWGATKSYSSTIHTKMQGHHDGSIAVGEECVLSDFLAEQGHIHNIFFSGNTVIKNGFALSARKGSGVGASTMLVCYGASNLNKTLELSGVGIVFDNADTGAIDANNSGLYAHAGDNSRLDEVIISDGSYVSGLVVSGVPMANKLSCRDSYLRKTSNLFSVDSVSAARAVSYVSCLMKRNLPYTHNRLPGADFNLLDTAIYQDVNLRLFEMYGTNGHAVDIRQSDIFAALGAILVPSGMIPATIAVNKSIIQALTSTSLLAIPTGSVYTGDYNIFYRPTGSSYFNYNGSNLATLALWQAATGQDEHSVFLTTDQYANFWLGTTANGDFRINPAAQVTAGNGTVYTGTFPDGTLLTTAGAQNHYDWGQKKRASGPPIEWPDAYIPLTRAQIITHLSD